jgi:hypothetical protein
VAIPETDTVSLDGADLVALPLRQWRQLDDSFPFDDDKYERSRPIFLHGRLPAREAGAGYDHLRETIDKAVDHFYHAFLLIPGAPLLPTPRLSVRYLAVEDEGQITSHLAFIGPLEREWLVFGNKLEFEFRHDSFQALDHILRLLRAVPDAARPAGLNSAIATLELTARPEFWWDRTALQQANSYIHAIAAVEQCLLPERERQPRELSLTELFGRRSAVLLTLNHDDLADQIRQMRAHYRLRSRLIHGETNAETLAEDDQQRLATGRLLLGAVLLRLLALAYSGLENKALLPLLDRALTNREPFEEVQQRIRRGFGH